MSENGDSKDQAALKYLTANIRATSAVCQFNSVQQTPVSQCIFSYLFFPVSVEHFLYNVRHMCTPFTLIFIVIQFLKCRRFFHCQIEYNLE